MGIASGTFTGPFGTGMAEHVLTGRQGQKAGEDKCQRNFLVTRHYAPECITDLWPLVCRPHEADASAVAGHQPAALLPPPISWAVPANLGPRPTVRLVLAGQ